MPVDMVFDHLVGQLAEGRQSIEAIKFGSVLRKD